MWATGGLMPVRTYLLDMDPTAAHRRLQHDADRMESAGDEFQQRTRQAFLDLAGHEPGRFRVIDAAWPIEAVWEHIKADVTRCWPMPRRMSGPRRRRLPLRLPSLRKATVTLRLEVRDERMGLHCRPAGSGRPTAGHRLRRPEGAGPVVADLRTARFRTLECCARVRGRAGKP